MEQESDNKQNSVVTENTNTNDVNESRRKLPLAKKSANGDENVNFLNISQIGTKNTKAVIFFLIAVLVVTGLAFLIAFFLTLQGEEQILVPDVLHMDLPSALIKMQEKELYPRIALRFTNEPNSQGQIIEQDPAPGTIVKAGRRIALTVSRGATTDRIGDYIGQDVETVRLQLQTIFASTRQLITIKEPIVYVFDESPAGTILEQSPAPDTEISGVTPVSLVVSRGTKTQKIEVPNFVGLSLNKAIEQISNSGIAFRFEIRTAQGKEKPDTIVSQKQSPKSMVDPLEAVVLGYVPPKEKEGIVNGVFSIKLPEYPYPEKTVLIAEPNSGANILLARVLHSGGEFSLPYSVPSGSVLVLTVLDKIVARVEAGQ